MHKILFFIIISLQLNGQINYVIDTLFTTHSERYPVSAGEIFRYHYFITDEDKELTKSQITYDKYHPFRKVTSGLKSDNKNIDIEDIISIKCFNTYNFIFPFAFYKLEQELLLENGIEIVNKMGELKHFGRSNTMLLNFFYNERAIHHIEFTNLKVDGLIFEKIMKTKPFDKVEIILINDWDDTLRMNFILQDY